MFFSTQQTWLVCSDLGCRLLLIPSDMAYPLLAAHSPVLWNFVFLLPPALTLQVYTVCVHMCMSCLCASSLSCEAAALPAAILLPCRTYPSVNPHQIRSTCASSHMHGDVGCIETSMKKRSLTQDVAITCFKRQWTSCNTVTKSVNSLMLQPKYLTFREFIFKNKHFTISFQITNRSEMAANHLSSNIWWFESMEGSYVNRTEL